MTPSHLTRLYSVIVATFVCILASAPPAAAQCDGGEATVGSWSCPANCAGGNPGEHKSCTHGGSVQAKAYCLNTSWKTVNGSSQAFGKPDGAECGPAVANEAPVCLPEAAGPMYWGIFSGVVRFKHSTRPGVSTGPLSCDVGAWTNEFKDLTAMGCCTSGCQDPTGCQAISRVYTPSPSCTCAEPPNCSFCYSYSLPCENGSEYDAQCNCCYFPGSPIVFDLDVNRIAFSSPQEGFVFDIRANGRPVRVSWPTSDRAYWLALDRNGNKRIDDGSELFGNATRLKAGGIAEHGYIALGEFDDDRNGRIDAADPIYSQLVLWRHPLSAPGLESDEYRTLADSGVKSISLQFSESNKRDRWGNWFRYRAAIRIQDSETRWSYDVFLAEAPKVVTTAGPSCQGGRGQNTCTQ